MAAQYRPGQVAELLGVSVDTVRRWTDSGRLAVERTEDGRRLIDGVGLARFLADQPSASEPDTFRAQSTRNRFPGIVTAVAKDDIVAKVEIQAGPYRIVSLMTAEAAEELGLEPGVYAVAAVKSTNVIIEMPEGPGR